MISRPGVIERAYQLAQSGQFTTVTQVRQKLKGEGYTGIDGHLDGRSLQASLRAFLRARTQEAELPESSQ